MIAKFTSTCPFCRTTIEAGVDEVSRRDTKWGHAKCPPSVSVSASPVAKHNFNSVARAITEAPVASAVLAGQEESTLATTVSIVDSNYQTAIYEWVANGTGNAVVEAVAGSGKTTTLVRALAFTPKDKDVVFCAFNKHIADELRTRAPSHVRVGTLHSLGFQNLRQTFGKVQVSDEKLDRIMDVYLPYDADADMLERVEIRAKRGILRKVTSLAKAVLCSGEDVLELEALADRYDVDLNSSGDEVLPLVKNVLRDCLNETTTIDYDDMIWIPVVSNMSLIQYDFVFGDEVQDWNKSQIEFILRSVKPGGRVLAVGDRNQSLYGFRGADTEAIPNLITALNAQVLPLSICYRCPRSHVALAQRLVPQIEARSDAPEGVIKNVMEDSLAGIVQAGDMIVCRVNAPLVPVAFDLIRRNVKAVVRGKEIGKGLVEFVKKFKADTLDDLFTRMEEYKRKEVSRLSKREGKEMQIETLIDKCDTINAVSEEVASVYLLTKKLEDLFSDTVEGVVLSSIHRAKGLQAERVVILRPDLLPHPRAKDGWQLQQELNCQYVAYTRSKRELYFTS